MRTMIEKVDLSVTTLKNALPTAKPVAGKFRLSQDLGTASFVEEEGASVIYGEPKSHTLMRDTSCSVKWDSKREEYIVRVRVKPSLRAAMRGDWDCEKCMNFIKRRIKEKQLKTQEDEQ